MLSTSSQQATAAKGGDAGGGGEIDSLSGLWEGKVAADTRSLFASFGKAAALDFLVEETKNVEQVVAGGVHEVREDWQGRDETFSEKEKEKRRKSSFSGSTLGDSINVQPCIVLRKRKRKIRPIP